MRVLVTGATGRIGSAFAASCEGSDMDIVRADVVDRHPTSPFRFLELDVTDPGACRKACRGVDGVLHLAADPDPDADFAESVLPLNIAGAHNMASAAVAGGIRRFVFASSVQAVEGYPHDHQVRETDAPWPGNDYGVGKAFGEALCASLAFRSSVTFVAVRIGNYATEVPPADAPFRDRTAWLSPADAHQLLRLALTRPVDGFLLAHGVSDNAVKRIGIRATSAALGYAPVDDAFADR